MLGYESTVRVTMEEMLHHTRAVVRGTQRALIVGDMPFLTYATPEEALENAGRFMREAGAGAVKIEGGVRSARIIETLVRPASRSWATSAGRPRRVTAWAARPGSRARTATGRARCSRTRSRCRRRARSPWCWSWCPSSWRAAITERLRIPTIGIGAGAQCSGQVQVITDLLGLGSFIPRHARPYADLRETIAEAAARHMPPTSSPATSRAPQQSTRMDEAVLADVLGARLRSTAPAPSRWSPIPLDRDL